MSVSPSTLLRAVSLSNGERGVRGRCITLSHQGRGPDRT